MGKIRYQHRRNCTLITPLGNVELDEDGYVTNVEKFSKTKLLGIEGMVDSDVFGEAPSRPKSTENKTNPRAAAPNDDDYWVLIKDLVSKGASTNAGGYIEMADLTPVLRERGWQLLSGLRRNQITDTGKEKDKASIPIENL